MSDERKELRWLEVMIASMEKVQKDYYAFYVRKDDIDKLKQLYQELIQQQPEIGEKYVEGKAREIFVYPWENLSLKNLESIITQIIKDVKGRGTVVSKEFIENWRKRFFLLLVKFEEKGMLDDDDKTVLHSLEVNLDNFISEMLTEAKVEIKK